MDPFTATAAAGLRGRIEALELLANNIANSSTTGFKADRELYHQYEAGEAWDANTGGPAPVTMPDIQNRWTDFSQGALQVTGNPLDLALNGRGFFVVRDERARPAATLYTRDGHFELRPVAADPANPLERRARLETADGLPVLDRDNKPVLVDWRLPVEITRDATVRQEGRAIARLRIDEPGELAVKRSGNYFSLDRTLNVAAGAPQPASERTEVYQGKLEAANAAPAESSVRLIQVLRQFEALNRAITLGGEMNRKAVDEVARVAS
jgi:flagellar basal body rod protein FlgG